MIKVTNLRKIDKKGLIAVFDVEVGGVDCRKCKLVQFKGEYSVTGPSEKYFSTKENKDKWFELVRFSDEIKNSLLDTVLKLADIEQQERKPEVPSDDDIPF